jgi:nucleoside-diphosphate-sugar epimerase
MKVFVTGALGNVGRFVLDNLLAMGEKVVAAGTNLEKLNKVFGNNDMVTTVRFDFTDCTTFNFMTRMGTAKAVTDCYEKLTGKKPTTFKEFAIENADAWK